MSKAKYYIYRNLNKGGFSVKYKGLVVAVVERLRAFHVTFQVSAAGRARALRERRRNVHAYASCQSWHKVNELDTTDLVEVYYNPFKCDQFQSQGRDIQQADNVYFKDGRCYVDSA